MRVEEVLAPLETRRVLSIAQALELSTAGLDREALVVRIGRVLDLLPQSDGLRALVMVLSLEDCRDVLDAYGVDDVHADAPELRSRLQALLPHPAPPMQAKPASTTVGHALFRHAFVPGLLLLWALAWMLRAHIPFGFLTPVLLGSLLLIAVAEQLYPANSAWNYRLRTGGAHAWRQLGRDLFYLSAIAQVSVLVVARVAPLLARWVPAHAWLASWSLPLRVAVVFLAVELASYWLHRAAHAVPLLWRFHSTHHVITELTGLKALRTHPVDNVLFALVRSVPLLLLGASPIEVLAVTYLASVLSLLAHANVVHAGTPLGLVVNLPRYHAVHHSADEVESRSNFGCHTILWDRLFGTFRQHPDGAVEIGVRPVGPRTLWQELVAPFYR